MTPDTLNITSIELDTSIQCRAAIDTGVVSDYAEALIHGAHNALLATGECALTAGLVSPSFASGRSL